MIMIIMIVIRLQVKHMYPWGQIRHNGAASLPLCLVHALTPLGKHVSQLACTVLGRQAQCLTLQTITQTGMRKLLNALFPT